MSRADVVVVRDDSRVERRPVAAFRPMLTREPTAVCPSILIHTRRGRARAVSGMRLICLERLLAYPELPFRLHPNSIVKQDRSTLVVRAELSWIGGLRRTVAAKRITRRGVIRALTDLFRPARADRGFRNGHRLLRDGIATPLPLVSLCPAGRSRRSYLFTEWLEGAEQLDRFCARLARHPPEVRQRLSRSAARRLGALIGRLHAAGWTHRDLKVANLMVRQNGDQVDVWIVDLDGLARRPWKPTGRRRMRDLARLSLCFEADPRVSLSTRMALIRAYCQTLAASDSPREVWRALSSATGLLKRRKQQRRMRRRPRGEASQAQNETADRVKRRPAA